MKTPAIDTQAIVRICRAGGAVHVEVNGKAVLDYAYEPAPLPEALRVRDRHPGFVLDPLARAGLDGIEKGMYLFRKAPAGPAAVQLMGSGAILREVIAAALPVPARTTLSSMLRT